jgi:hypothetical protein
MHPKVRMFLQARDRAYVRQDMGIIRSMNFELRRLGVSDTATLQDPSGKHPASNGEGKPEPKRAGRPPKPRCEHGAIADRCTECEQAEIEETLAEAG